MIFCMKEIIKKKSNFANNLRYYRKKNSMSQGELAEKLNVTHQAVSYYENGLRTCSFDMLIEIAELFGVSTDDLLR